MGDSTAIPHVIGTVALIFLFFSLTAYYNGFVSQLNLQGYKTQLGQIGEYYAANLNDLVALASLVEEDVFLIKEMKTATFIGDRIYNVSIMRTTPSGSGQQILAVSTRLESLNLYASTELIWSPELNIGVYTNQSIPQAPSNLSLRTFVHSDAAVTRAAQTSGSAQIVVWCRKASGSIVLGVGVKDVL